MYVHMQRKLTQVQEALDAKRAAVLQQPPKPGAANTEINK
jgi:hypothetical protein